MKLVINIPEETYEHTKNLISLGYSNGYEVIFAIANSTPLNEVLDKIRAEIMDFEEELFHRPNTDYTDYAAVRHCVEIIDRYTKDGE